MAFPKKLRFRRITIDGVVYRWQFSGGEMQGVISIYGPLSSGRNLKIRSQDWFDMWLSYPFHRWRASHIVTPALVRQAIEFALSRGWEPNSRGKPFILEYGAGEFRFIEQEN